MKIVDAVHGMAIRAAFGLWHGWRPYGRHAAFLERSQWWPRARLEELQMQKLSGLLEHAYAKVPFYRHRFDEAGVRPSSIQSPADLRCLPILTKQDIQEHREELLTGGADRKQLIENHTGGSTGSPLTFYQDPSFAAWSDADKLRNYRMAGYELGQRWAFLWGSDYDAGTHKGQYGRFKDWLVYNTLWINTFDLTLDTLRQAAVQLSHWKPEILVAYVSSAVLLARLVQEGGVPEIRFRAIQTSAEVLTPEARQLLQETFGCPAFDRYGCREVGNIAHECDAHQGLHILAENNLVEFMDSEGHPAPPGQLGRMVVTNLNNYAMPLIRYETGDWGVYSDQPCRCDRGLPVLKTVVGRTSDIITSPSGKLLHGEFFTHLFYKISGIYQFRVVQETLADLQIYIVPGMGFEQQEAFKFLEDTIHQYGDAAFRVRFVLCDSLPPAPSGKYRFTISKVPLSLGRE